MKEEIYQFIKIDSFSLDMEIDILIFLQKCSGFHYFQSPHYFKICKESKKLKPYYIIAKANNDIVGCLLFFKQVLLTLPIASFLSSRTIIWGGPVVLNDSIEIINGILRFYKGNGLNTIYTQVRNLVDTSVYKDQFIDLGFRYEPHLNFLVDLTHTEDVLWKNVHSKRRNQIRRAEKEGCSVEQENSKEALRVSYTILENVYKQAKLPIPDFSHFESLLRQTDADSGLRLFTVRWSGEIIGCMICLAYGNHLYDYYAGSNSHHYKKYPNDLIPWAVFKWGKENNYTHFDFGGAGKPDVPYGVRDYKKQFGGELVCFGRYEYLHFPRIYKVVSLLFLILQKLKIQL